MIFSHFFYIHEYGKVIDRGVKVGENDQKLVRMINIRINLPPNLVGFEAALLIDIEIYSRSLKMLWKILGALREYLGCTSRAPVSQNPVWLRLSVQFEYEYTIATSSP